MIEDRELVVQPGEHVKTAWIDIDACRMANRTPMDFAAIERAGRKLMQLGDAQTFPPVNGRWDGERFDIFDGRHEYLAALALGREKLFVAWIAP